MYAFRDSFIKPIFIITILTIGFFNGNAQKFIPTSAVITSFQKELDKTPQNEDTLKVYLNHIQRLVRRGNYAIADSVVSQALPGFLAYNDASLIADLYKERANMYKIQGRYNKSLEDYLWLKSHYEGANDPDALAEIYSLMAEYYRAFGEYDLMATHLELAKKIIDQGGVSQKNMAYWYSRKAAWISGRDSIRFYAQRGLNLARSSNNIYVQALTLNELGVNEMRNLDMRPQGFKYLEESKDLLIQNEFYRDYVDIVNNIARYTPQSNGDEILLLLEENIKLEEENNWFSPMVYTLRFAADLHLAKGNIEKSDDLRHRWYEVRLEEKEYENAIAVSDLALTYSNQLTEIELENQEQKTLIAEAEAKSNRRAFALTAVVAFLLALISVIVIFVNRRFRKKNKLLEERKIAIELAKQELEQSLDHQTSLYKELNHRVKNNLSVLSGLVYLQELEEPDESFQSSLKDLRRRIKSMAIAHERFYNTESTGKINFTEYLQTLFEELRDSLADRDKISTEINFPEFKMDIQKAVPLAMIINELFTNSVKHAFNESNEGTINVNGELDNHTVKLNYFDNGSGYENRLKDNLGLELVNLLVDQINGEIQDNTTKNGFNILISFPI